MIVFDSTSIAICILSGWFSYLIIAWYASQRRPSIASKLLLPIRSFGSVLVISEIILWSIFPVAVLVTQNILNILEPNLHSNILSQLFIQWLGYSIILGLVEVYVFKRGQHALSEKTDSRIMLILSLILLLLVVVSFCLIY